MDITEDPNFKKLAQDWNQTDHPQERRTIYNLAAHYCQERGYRLNKQDNEWAIEPSKR